MIITARIVIAVVLLIITACASGPSQFEQTMAAIDASNADRAKINAERQWLLQNTPHEKCLGKETRDRYGSTIECKEDIARQQAEVRAAIMHDEQDAQQRQQMAIGILSGRPPAPSFQPMPVPLQPQTKMFVPPPVQQPVNCSSVAIGNTVQTNCR